jgi:hypothetical protein
MSGVMVKLYFPSGRPLTEISLYIYIRRISFKEKRLVAVATANFSIGVIVPLIAPYAVSTVLITGFNLYPPLTIDLLASKSKNT